jgi:hypothetical protein
MGRPPRRQQVRRRRVGLGRSLDAGRCGTRWAMRVQLGGDEPVVCAEWDLARPAIPSRSRLYSLEPIGIGTVDGEPDQLR